MKCINTFKSLGLFLYSKKENINEMISSITDIETKMQTYRVFMKKYRLYQQKESAIQLGHLYLSQLDSEIKKEASIDKLKDYTKN